MGHHIFNKIVTTELGAYWAVQIINWNNDSTDNNEIRTNIWSKRLAKHQKTLHFWKTIASFCIAFLTQCSLFIYLFIYLFILLFTPIWTQLAQLWMAQFQLMSPRWLIVLLDSTSQESITFSSNFQKTFPLKYSDPSSLIEIVWNTENEKCILGEFGQNFTWLFFLP